jgi:hypothetical protein
MGEERTFRLGIHGSRTLRDERVKIIILEEIEKHNPTSITTHAEPEGVCGVGRRICRERGIPLKLHFLNFKYLRGAFEHRSKEVLRDSDFSIFIHDGKSKGTANEVALCKKMKLPHSEYTLEPTTFESSVGFPVLEEWNVDLRDVDAVLKDDHALLR